MLVAGGETTDKAISNLWWNLLTNPDALVAVTADSGLLDAAFSESMRKDGPCSTRTGSRQPTSSGTA